MIHGVDTVGKCYKQTRLCSYKINYNNKKWPDRFDSDLIGLHTIYIEIMASGIELKTFCTSQDAIICWSPDSYRCFITGNIYIDVLLWNLKSIGN